MAGSKGFNEPVPSDSSTRVQELKDVFDSVLAPIGLEVLELEIGKRSLRVSVEGEGSQAMDAIEKASRLLSDTVDSMNLDGLFSGAYELEVSSPGLERPLKKLEHFRRFKEALVDIKWRNGDDNTVKKARVRVGDVKGSTVEFYSDDASLSLEVPFEDILRARTVFVWGAQGGKPKGTKAKSAGSIEEVEEDGEE
ncbi:ribosome maturation factor RimP [Ferrithrix thermotolerans DSM 19514]|uniref:Ribosome maturation factor RimP n=1 Tax=Ferrithrix thermotolerans DSM 19514 TaxID=1121881 RepID=A0A1M4TP15_9ACTN|nr:hypothetical protein [Ferrithrix thermotolerans]SHE46116.1 ribosome maturation factor RimP [Ferrithrix thermotolerans DSM 19514]